MEQHTVVGDQLVGLGEVAGTALRIATAKISGRQHGLHPHAPQHRLCGETHLREEPFRSAAREIEHGLRFGRGRLRVADHRHIVLVLDVEEGARGLLGYA